MVSLRKQHSCNNLTIITIEYVYRDVYSESQKSVRRFKSLRFYLEATSDTQKGHAKGARNLIFVILCMFVYKELFPGSLSNKA